MVYALPQIKVSSSGYKNRKLILCAYKNLKPKLLIFSSDILSPDGYHGYFHCSERKGYSGVGIYCKQKPNKIIEGVGISKIDTEGRYLRADFDNLSVISVYFPSGSSGEHRQAAKFFFLKTLLSITKKAH